MARTLSEIKQSICSNFISNETLVQVYGLDPLKTFEQQFSVVSFESLFIDVISIAIYTHERLFDTHSNEVTKVISEQKAHTPAWYRMKALAYQFGFSLKENSDLFDNSTTTEDQVNNSKIVKYCAINESVDSSTLIVKIAGENINGLTPLDHEQINSFEQYLKRIKDAGVKINVINYPADMLKLYLRIHYDPLVLSSNGMNMRTGEFPVVKAIDEFLRDLPFNGELILAKLVGKLQTIEGVVIPTIESAWSKWITPDDSAVYEPYSEIQIKRIPESGYFKLDTETEIDYVAQY